MISWELLLLLQNKLNLRHIPHMFGMRLFTSFLSEEMWKAKVILNPNSVRCTEVENQVPNRSTRLGRHPWLEAAAPWHPAN